VKVLLNLAYDVAHHLFGILTGNRRFRDGVEKREVPGTPLFLSEQASIFHGHAELAGSSLHYFKVARFEHILALRAQSTHHSGRHASSMMGTAQNDFAGRENEVQCELRSHLFEIRLDKQRLAVRRMCSVSPLLNGRDRFGKARPPSTSSSKRISSSS